jgi:prophage maintenance system killer protein
MGADVLTRQAGHGDVAVYQGEDGALQVEARIAGDTLWLPMARIAELFGVNVPAVSKHIKNIYATEELEPAATLSKMETVRPEGKRQVKRNVEHYNLDMVISVGYRVNSNQATRFRIWATRILKEHLTRGYTLNRQRFERNARELEAALQLVRKAATSGELSAESGRGLVDIIARYTQTFLLLQRYDEGLLTEPRGVAGGQLPTVAEARSAIATLKKDLIGHREATPLFGQEREEGLAGILGNLDQTVFGEPAYPSIEAKAAHLLYFVIKNHPFSDGNKRIGSFLFVDFLHRNARLFRDDVPVINDIGLAALALLVAESDPKDKDVFIRLVMNMLARRAA